MGMQIAVGCWHVDPPACARGRFPLGLGTGARARRGRDPGAHRDAVLRSSDPAGLDGEQDLLAAVDLGEGHARHRRGRGGCLTPPTLRSRPAGAGNVGLARVRSRSSRGRRIPTRPARRPSLENQMSVLGPTGVTAYFGFAERSVRAQAGETVLVSGAAGATGQRVGQIAKTLGCRWWAWQGESKSAAT